MDLEQGFRRITMALSLGMLVVCLAFVAWIEGQLIVRDPSSVTWGVGVTRGYRELKPFPEGPPPRKDKEPAGDFKGVSPDLFRDLPGGNPTSGNPLRDNPFLEMGTPPVSYETHPWLVALVGIPLSIGFAASPWGVFFLLRWIARGFLQTPS